MDERKEIINGVIMTTKMETRRDFRIGDRVFYTGTVEWGTVIEVKDYDEFEDRPIEVEFNDGERRYFRSDGCLCNWHKRSLFFTDILNNPPLEAIEKIDFPDLAIDTKLYVWNYHGEEKFKRHFSHFDCDGVECFSSGRTSFTAIDEATTHWNHWELAED